MILYFADRQLNILGQASTKLPKGLTVTGDLKAEDIETGIATFECYIPFDKNTRGHVENCAEVGNYLLRSHNGENEFYTIVDAEVDTKKQQVYIYAEDDGMDLLNEVFGEYEADKAYSIDHYINKFAAGSGFEIGINEAKGLTRKLSWDGEETATARIASVATQFDGCEISFSFDIDGLVVTKKYINIYKQRGKDVSVPLRLNKEIDSIITSKSIANLATALQCEGGTPDEEENPITLKGYKYDDGDFYVDGTVLKSRTALKQWRRVLCKSDGTTQSGGHIIKLYSYDTTSQKTLCSHAITELKKIRDIEVNYEIDIKELPDTVKIGDRVNIVDDAGELYVSARVLKLTTSVADQEHTATLGEYLIKGSGISQKVADLAAQFAKNTKSAAKALSVSNAAKTAAENAQAVADEAAAGAEVAQSKADEAKAAADIATESAEAAQTAANNAQAAVGAVEESITEIEETVTEAKNAANNAQLAAETAETKAEEAKTAALQAKTDAENAATAAGNAQTAADSAISKADEAQNTANTAKTTAEAASATAQAAKQDAEQAEADIASLGERLTTVSNTMQADYARKTDLTEATASLQTQITQNAAEITSTAAKVQTIDETANNAAEQAQAAQDAAALAQTQADTATADAQAAQTKADEAKAAATSAQTEADNAKAAAATAQSVADKAEADLAAAQADLATVSSRVDATEADITAAQNAVNTAQAAADKAKADAATAAEKAATAQNTANTAVTNAANAQTAANDAASKAAIAQQTADEAKGNATAAQTAANEAAAKANAAQETANTAKTNAETAQAKANEAAQAAAEAQAAADDADTKAAQAASDLAAAQQNLADVTARVDATEEEVAAAQADVVKAQAAADKAKADAATAQSTADTAKANAATAQTAANNAKTAADNAQAAADDAQAAADKAQADVNALSVRVTAAETSITQNSEKIELRATKVELTESIDNIKVGGRNLVPVSKIAAGRNVVTTQDFEIRDVWGTVFISAGNLPTILAPNTKYTVRYELELIEKTTVPTAFDMRAGFLIYREGVWLDIGTYAFSKSAEVGEKATVQHTFTTPETWNGEQLICYSRRWTTAGSSPVGFDAFRVTDFKIETGAKATDWTPAPEDVDEATNAAQNTANDAVLKVSVAESTIQQLADSIAMLVTDGNGASLMTQTESGWTFSTAQIQDTVNSTSASLDELIKEFGSVDAAVEALKRSVADIGTKTNNVHVGEYTYKNDQGEAITEPSIELWQESNTPEDDIHKLVITNKRILFKIGENEPTRITADGLITENITIENEHRQTHEDVAGHWVWAVRANGNYGLLWEGADE